LNSLSPEKLKEIKSKVLEIAAEKCDEPEQQQQPQQQQSEQQQQQPAETNENIDSIKPTTPNDVDGEIICLDSDDEAEGSNVNVTNNGNGNSAPTNNKLVENQQNNEEKENTNSSNTVTSSNENSNSSWTNEHGSLKRKKSVSDKIEKIGKSLKECINPDCPRIVNDEFIDSPLFVINMYQVTYKSDKENWVCNTCYEKSLDTYEKLMNQIVNNKSWRKVEIPKKKELVEIVDSDEEENTQGKKRVKVPEKDMFVFNKEVEEQVEEILTDLMKDIDIKMQLDSEEKHLERRMKRNAENLKSLDDELKKVEKISAQMYNEIYSLSRPRYQRRQSINLELVITNGVAHDKSKPPTNSVAVPPICTQTVQKTRPDISITPIEKSIIKRIPMSPAMNQMEHVSKKANTIIGRLPNEKIFHAIREPSVAMPHWIQCRLLEEFKTPDGTRYKVQFLDNSPNNVLIVTGKQIADYMTNEKLDIGTRVIAEFPRATKFKHANGPLQRFFPGVIGEKMSSYNNHRYLIFCDYGQVKYCQPGEVRKIMEASSHVWDDVHPNLKQFIRDYLESKSSRSRALLNVRVNTQIFAEKGGAWRKLINLFLYLRAIIIFISSL
jgi:hypothetical protein